MTTQTTLRPSATRPTARTTTAQRWVLTFTSLASFMVVLDLLVVATALSTIQRSLGASLSDLQWTVTAYTLTFAVLLMAAAALGGRYGRRRVLVIGLAVFGLASAACALAPTTSVLIGARAVQGLGAAAVMPMALTLLNSAFPPERRGWATGIYGSVTALAVVLGPLLGGAVAQGIAWQWIFWLNVPLALGSIPFILAQVPEEYGPPIAADLGGLTLGAGACLGLVWGLIRANDSGWTSAPVLSALIGGALLAVGFATWERRAKAPMVPLRLFGSRGFTAGSVVIFLLSGGLTATVFFTAQYLQIGLGHDPLIAGLQLLPWGVMPLVLAPSAGALADRFGPRLPVIAGMAAFTVATGWLALIATPHVTYIAFVVPMILSGTGLALAIPAVTKSVVSAVEPADLGTASGTFSTMRQLGGAFGVAVTGAAFAAHGGIGSASAFSNGYRAAIAVAAVLALAGLVVATALSRGRGPR